MMDKKVWIILAVVMGTLVLLLAVTLALFCAKRSKKRIRGFSLRAVTPLDDAEFESWRRPSQYTKRPEKYGIRPTQPVIVRSTRTPNMFETNMFEKELSLYNSPRTPSPQYEDKTLISPTTPIRKPQRARRKSSVSSSLADRPPTPYSPASTTGEFPRRSSHASRKSSTPHIHYPSMSETSAFDFKFDFEDDYPPRGQPRRSNQSDRPLSYSYARYGESV
jgi:hypothetical protein